MRCEAAALELLDDAQPPSGEALSHARTCGDCRQLASAHQSALRLRGAPTLLTPVRGSLPVRSWWRRRLALRGALAVMATAGALALVMVWQQPVPPDAVVAVVEESAMAEVPVQDVEALLLEVHSYTRERSPAEDATLAPFGEVPGLLAPAITTVGIRERTQP